jgi:hypothetical protein
MKAGAICSTKELKGGAFITQTEKAEVAQEQIN